MQEQFLQQIEANKGILFKISRSFCHGRADQEDLRQEMLLRLWKGLPRYDPAFAFTTWMYRVALNVAISWQRQAKRNSGTVPFMDMHGEMADGADGTHPRQYPLEDQHSPMILLQKHVAALKELEKALMLLYFEEKSYREIAEIMGITETNVATKVSRIKEKLKQAILNDKNLVYGRS
ncbi:MAG TPA: sigma-70 family RNA polymerase sigma factor [Puia sp.]|uniref:RNA polymerase sigma factor n=1 Tax=Puia sp. TaxID=2045100 RepID=UPI002CE15885|nr:sigma-70 family RNA polymerase sigma factor [Puia sp.]HVU96277.1 sigma-70 family RNA polymerase sigma factor [Puia sp.]